MNTHTDSESCRRLLREIAAMCEEASLTGSLAGGAARTATRYNSILSHLVGEDVVAEGIFSPLSESADFSEIGVEARMLASFLPDTGKARWKDRIDRNILLRLAPFIDRHDLGDLIREQMKSGITIDIDGLTGLAPFLGKDILGEMLRGHIASARQCAEEASEPAAAPSPPRAPTPPTPPGSPAAESSPVEGVVDQIETLAELLKNPHLSNQEREDLVDRIRAAASRI